MVVRQMAWPERNQAVAAAVQQYQAARLVGLEELN